ncbi:class I adenylate-forming enzyme family protein [Amycolatopsis nigrescens]|uniref:class I adenylate-forming enzyme family protein n=1 Tax=Amycolatopsis nigrescens TaxID=381445 RepID=UPI00037A4D87|nr:AMP-binding protein [Amycolatopsis nigrescens]
MALTSGFSATFPKTPKTLTYPDVPVGSIAAGAAARYGDRTAFAHGDRRLSFAELYAAACRFANALGARGIGPGDTVAVHLPNGLGYPVAYYGISLAGATFSPANPLLPPPALAAQLNDCGAVAAITHNPAALPGGLRLTVVDGPGTPAPRQVKFERFHADLPGERPEIDLDAHESLAHVAYTGGTTGRSKGVRLTHRNVVTNAVQYACWASGSMPALDTDGNPVLNQVGDEQEWPIRLGTGVAINLTPFFHAMGTVGALIVPLLTGATTVLHDRLQPPAYLADAERLRVTTMAGAPALFAALLADPDIRARDLSSVRVVTSGAAPMAHEMINALRLLLPAAVISEGYGLTEVTMGAVSSPVFRSGVRKVGAVGLPIFDTEVRIMPPDGGGGEPLPAGQPGEVCLRGPQVMRGYLNRPEETAETLVDGWLRTGDIGVLDEDGYLSIVDRKKDLLLYKGYNVYPRELEEMLTDQPGVAAAAVVGRPSQEVGELPVAFVVRAPDADDLTEAELMAVVNENVVPYKRLRELRFVERLPVSAAGKILKRELREQLD